MTEKKVIQIYVNDKIYQELDNYCKEMGQTKSSVCSIALSQYLRQFKKGEEVAQQFVNSLINNPTLLDAIKENLQEK